jgi:SSS family solute:Na+ symporter
MNRMSIVFVASLVLAVINSLAKPQPREANLSTMTDVSFHTTSGFNIAGILIALYCVW